MPWIEGFIKSLVFHPLGSALGVTLLMAFIAGLTETLIRSENKWPSWNVGMSLALSGLAFCITCLGDFLRAKKANTQQAISISIDDAGMVLGLATFTFMLILILMRLSQSYHNRRKELQGRDVLLLNVIGAIPLLASALLLWS